MAFVGGKSKKDKKTKKDKKLKKTGSKKILE